MTDDEDGDGFRVLKERRVPAGQPFNGDDEEEDDEDDEGEEEEVSSFLEFCRKSPPSS